MKKLLKLLSAALITAAMFMSCGNPASTTVPDQDDGLTVEQFQSKLLAFECGITASGNAVIIYKVENQEKDEYLYIKREGTWEYAGNTSLLLDLKKENNEFYITGDGQKIYSYSFEENNLNLISSLPEFSEFFGSNTATFIKTEIDNLPADLKPLLETVEQFRSKLLSFECGITASGNAVIIYKQSYSDYTEYLYIKREGTWEYAGNTSLLLDLKKENNEFYITGDGQKIYSYSFEENNLNLISSLPEFSEFFGSNTATFIKTEIDNLPADLKPLLEKDDGETV